MVCQTCALSSSASGDAVHTSLQLMRELATQLPVGPHLSFDLLTCLFGVVEQYHTSQQASHPKNAVDALLAVEILTEVMSKRYIPPVAEGSSGDAGAGILVELVAQAVGLLQSLP